MNDILIQMIHLNEQVVAMRSEAKELLKKSRSARSEIAFNALSLFENGSEIPLHLVADLVGVEEWK